MDEFVYPSLPGDTIASVLAAQPRYVAHVQLVWKMFGGLREDADQPASVVRGFTRRGRIGVRGTAGYGHFKAAVRTSCLRKIGIHRHELTYLCGLLRLPALPPPAHAIDRPLLWRYPAVMVRYPPTLTEVSLADPVATPLLLNHYAIQTYGWFMRIKSTRGDVLRTGWHHLRNRPYYIHYNRTEVVDDELARRSRAASYLTAARTHTARRSAGGQTRQRRARVWVPPAVDPR
jgi:hypothetical protein